MDNGCLYANDEKHSAFTGEYKLGAYKGDRAAVIVLLCSKHAEKAIKGGAVVEK